MQIRSLAVVLLSLVAFVAAVPVASPEGVAAREVR